MREATTLERYFEFCKHLCVLDVIAGLASVVLLSWGASGSGPFGVLVLGAFFASFVFAARGVLRTAEGMPYPRIGVEPALRRRFALAAGSFAVGVVGIVSYAGIIFLI